MSAYNTLCIPDMLMILANELDHASLVALSMLCWDIRDQMRRLKLCIAMVGPAEKAFKAEQSGMFRITSLRVSPKTTNLEPVNLLRSLTNLDINGSDVADIARLQNLVHLESVNLNRTKVEDLWPIPLNIKTLRLSHTRVCDLSPILFCSRLLVLDLNETLVSDLKPISTLLSLQTLYLSKAPIEDVRPLAKRSRRVLDPL